MISDAMESGTIQINGAPARGPDHFPFQVCLHLFWLTRYCGSYARSLIESTHSYSLPSLIYNLDMAYCLGY